MSLNLKEGIITGALAGVVWGWLSMALNSLTGVVGFEGSFSHNLATFSAGGAIFGIVAGALLSVAGRWLPFKRALPKAVFVTIALWFVLKAGGTMLSMMEPDRYHMLNPESMQGLLLAAALGALLGLLWKKGSMAR